MYYVYVDIDYKFFFFLHIVGREYAYDFDKEMVIIENGLTTDKDVRNQDIADIQSYVIQTFQTIVEVVIVVNRRETIFVGQLTRKYGISVCAYNDYR